MKFSRSPIVYFEIVGTASFADECGALGTKVVASTIAIPPGVMSTISFDVPIGGTISAGVEAWKSRTVKPLDLRDLECPTWGLASQTPQSGRATALVGSPFFPMLVPPPQLLTVDVAWSKCMGNHWPLKYGIFDPPHALTPNAVLASPDESNPTVVPAFEPTVTLGAQPAQTPSVNLPQATVLPSDGEIPYSNDPVSGSSTSDQLDSPDDQPGEAENGAGQQPVESYVPGKSWTLQPSDEKSDDLTGNNGEAQPESPNSVGDGYAPQFDQGTSKNRPTPGQSDDSGNDAPHLSGGSDSSSGNSDHGFPHAENVGESGNNGFGGTHGGDSGDDEGGQDSGSLGEDFHSGSGNPNGSPSTDPVLSLPLLIGEHTYTREPGPCSCYIVGPGSTLTPGGSLRMSDGTNFALAANGEYALVGGKTQPLLISNDRSAQTNYRIPAFSGTAKPMPPESRLATFSVSNIAYSVMSAVNNPSGMVLFSDGRAITNLPVGLPVTLANGHIIEIEPSGVVMVDGQAAATVALPALEAIEQSSSLLTSLLSPDAWVTQASLGTGTALAPTTPTLVTPGSTPGQQVGAAIATAAGETLSFGSVGANPGMQGSAVGLNDTSSSSDGLPPTASISIVLTEDKKVEGGQNALRPVSALYLTVIIVLCWLLSR